jgi:hypothetical protein
MKVVCRAPLGREDEGTPRNSHFLAKLENKNIEQYNKGYGRQAILDQAYYLLVSVLSSCSP